MKYIEVPPQLVPGARAPEISVPAATHEGLIRLADYRGRSAVLVAMFRGLYCAFCRHHVALLGLAVDRLRAVGVETVGIMASPLDKLRLYFRHRPPRYPVGADPDLTSHRTFGIPRVELNDDLVRRVLENNDALAAETGLSFAPGGGWEALDRHEGVDRAEHEPDLYRHGGLFTGQFLIDRDGIVRWSQVECREDGLEGLDRFPTVAELLTVAQTLREPAKT